MPTSTNARHEAIKTLEDNYEDLFELLNSIRKEYDLEYLDVTLATDGESYVFQTGDNSYTGSCYAYPHWAVCSIGEDSNALDFYEEVVDQWLELLD